MKVTYSYSLNNTTEFILDTNLQSRLDSLSITKEGNLQLLDQNKNVMLDIHIPIGKSLNLKIEGIKQCLDNPN